MQWQRKKNENETQVSKKMHGQCHIDQQAIAQTGLKLL